MVDCVSVVSTTRHTSATWGSNQTGLIVQFACQYLCIAMCLTLLGKYVFSMTSRDPAPFHLVASSGIDEDAREKTT